VALDSPKQVSTRAPFLCTLCDEKWGLDFLQIVYFFVPDRSPKIFILLELRVTDRSMGSQNLESKDFIRKILRGKDLQDARIFQFFLDGFAKILILLRL